MPTKAIEVAFKDPPRAGGKNWKIKTKEREEFYLKPTLADKVEKGGTYEIDYKPCAFNGKDYNMVDAVRVAAIGHAPSGPVGIAPGTVASPSRKDREIAVLALAKSCLESGSVEMTEDMLVGLLRACGAAYDRTLGNPQRADDLDDAVPF